MVGVKFTIRDNIGENNLLDKKRPKNHTTINYHKKLYSHFFATFFYKFLKKSQKGLSMQVILI